MKKYREENKEYFKEYSKKYNKDYEKERLKIDPIFNGSLKPTTKETVTRLCHILQLRFYLET